MIAIINNVDLPSHYLGIDLTDIALVKDFDFMSYQLKQLEKFHIDVAIDDFSRGYASLAYFDKLHATSLKVARSYISEIPENVKDTALLNSLVSHASHKGISITAKGIENAEQLQHLHKIGCTQGQGFFLCKPLSKIDMMSYMLRAN